MRWASLRRLGAHPAFRRLLAIRVLAQGGDVVLQAGMMTYVLFSPQTQATAWGIAAMFAVTLLPFSLVGPFVAPLLDRWPRRAVAVAVDTTRTLVAAALVALVLGAGHARGAQPVFFGLLLVALSLNRFLLAGLAAALPHTVDDDEILEANSVLPLIAPVAATLGGVALGVRLALTQLAHWRSEHADALVFALAGVLFACSALTATGFASRALGPSDAEAARASATPRTVARELGATVASLADPRRSRASGVSLLVIFAQRVAFGLVQVATILLFRNRLHDAGDTAGALGDIGLWAALGGLGFVVAGLVTPAVVRALGLRATLVLTLVATAAVQLWPGSWLDRWPLLAASPLLGVCTQALKIAVDTVVQRNVPDAVKGRVFVLYDMVFNVAMVLAAVLGALVLPADGGSLLAFWGVAAAYVLLAALAWWLTSLDRPAYATD